MKPILCKDCLTEGVTRFRPVSPPGPRCTTHHRTRKRLTRAGVHERRVQDVYGLKPGEYGQIYKAQEGVCFICRRAKGVSRKLSVDHDHKTGLVRGLLCSTCNKILGHLRDDPEVARRIVTYLRWPPAQAIGIRAVYKDFREDGEDG